MTNPSRKDWSRLLKDALRAHRTVYLTLFGMSPYQIVFGKTYHLSVELEHKAYWAVKQSNLDYNQAGESMGTKSSHSMKVQHQLQFVPIKISEAEFIPVLCRLGRIRTSSKGSKRKEKKQVLANKKLSSLLLQDTAETDSISASLTAQQLTVGAAQ
ncbi:hypothetical protein CR513_55884, partial [Mucuna pruriens]